MSQLSGITKLQAPAGIDDFSKLIDSNRNNLFVDRSLWVRQIFQEGSDVIAFHTFRRSGKSLTASMLEYFFAAQVGSISTCGMFDPLKLGQEDPDFVKEHQGRYPVVAITLKNAQETTFQHTAKNLCLLVKEAYLKHLYLETSSFLSRQEKEQFSLYASAREDAVFSFEIWEKSLWKLIIFLEKHHQKRVFIIIDEYDAPLIAGARNGYLSEITAFLRELLGAALKSNYALEKGVLFGIVRFSKESFLSGLNNIKIYTLFKPGYYQPYFGFTEVEVIKLLEQAQISLDHLPEIRRWYDGYRVGEDELYNPLSIMEYIADPDHVPTVYWVNTGNDDLQRQLLNQASPDTQDKFRYLISEHQPISVELSDVVRFQDIFTDDSAFWALLYAAGYLTAAEPLKPVYTHYEGEVRIPNQEVLSLYIDVCRSWLKKEVLTKIPGSSLKTFYQAIQEGNADKLGHWLGDFLLTHTSHYHLTTESSFHTMLLGLAAGLVESHFVWSESESGDGRPDLMLVPKSAEISDLAWIFEFKRLSKTPRQKTTAMGQKRLEELAEQALEQITKNRYEAKLAALPYVKKILKIGMAFGGKTVVWKINRENV